MNVLLISEGYPPDRGGVSTSAARIAHALAEQDCSVLVVSYDQVRPFDLLSPPAVDVDEYATVMRIGPMATSFGRATSESVAARQKALLRRRFIEAIVDGLEDLAFKPSVILSLFLLNAGFLATFVARRLHIPHVTAIRGNDIGRNLFDPELLYATAFVLEHADAITSVNLHLKDRMLEAFPAHAPKTSIIRNTIAPARIPDRDAARRRILELAGWPPETLILCFNGAFREKKGALESLAALDRLQKSGSQARLLLVGDGPGRFEQEASGPLFDDLVGRGTILPLGPVARSSVTDWLAGADILLMPSLDDGLANALLEGMRAGLCAVVSRVLADVVDDGVTGIVIDRVTPDAIAAAIRRLELDRSQIRIIGQAAQRATREWRPDQEARAYRSLFEKLVLEPQDMPALHAASAA